LSLSTLSNIKKFFYNYVANKERTCNICKQWLCNGRREHLEMLFEYGRNFLTMEEIFPHKGIREKLKGKGKGLAFYTAANKLKP